VLPVHTSFSSSFFRPLVLRETLSRGVWVGGLARANAHPTTIVAKLQAALFPSNHWVSSCE
jgi:hypothetical protein